VPARCVELEHRNCCVFGDHRCYDCSRYTVGHVALHFRQHLSCILIILKNIFVILERGMNTPWTSNKIMNFCTTTWAWHVLIYLCHVGSNKLTYLLTYLPTYLLSLSIMTGDVDLMFNSSLPYFRACCNSPTRACKIVAPFILFYFILLQTSTHVQFILLQYLFSFIAHKTTA